ncbi:MAG: tetratricopeptide repeat protein [Syntrophobacteraceae bacterium]
MYIIALPPGVCTVSNLSRGGAGVRKIFAWFAIIALTASGTFGCASDNSPAAGQTGYSKQIEQQKRMSQELDAPKKLPEMTDDDYERLGDNFVQQGDLEKGFMQYDKLLRKKPDNGRLLYKRGMVFLVKDRSTEALGDFQEALKKEPGNALLHQGAGEALFKLKRTDEAEKEFQLALKSDGKLWLSHNFLGIIYDYKQRPDLAVEHYQAAISIRPEWGAVYNNLGVSRTLQGEWEMAVVAFEDAIKRGYSDPQVGNNLGLALCRLGRDTEAIEAFKRSGDEAQAYNNLGSFHLQQGDYEKAVSAFEKAIKLRPTFYAQASENLKKAQAALHSQPASEPAGSTEAPKKKPDDAPAVSQAFHDRIR